MGYQITLAPSARRDLRDIVRYISYDSPQRALVFGQFLLAQIKRLAEFPELGRIVPEFDRPEIREIVVRNYRVIYRVRSSEQFVEIVRFWHGARGIPKFKDRG